jgi:hypothetical protein
MQKLGFYIMMLLGAVELPAQAFEVGMETVVGPAYTTFRGDLSQMVGFSEIKLTEGQVDSALARANINAPRWLQELFPGIRIEVTGEAAKKMSRTIPSVRFFARFKFIGGSFTVSEPRLTEPLESRKLKNQLKAIRLSLAGNAEALAEHLAVVAIADVDRVDPFFSKRYDLEAYVHVKKLFLGEDPFLEWGKRGDNTLDWELTGGIRLTADPSPVVDLGSVLFIRERIDSLMEGGILTPVEHITDEIAGAIQNIVFGKFKDPRVVPSLGWFLRGEVPANFGGAFSAVGGAELSINQHLAVKGTRPMFSFYGFVGLRWAILGKK